ncbi:hypothetical protein [Gandjariella thermophila]|uniref:Uncharacterized protein n=1 Tax=Gandjariella thermophila TaxID=1931992 RepID=A0A4D4J8Y8_9PSEU|nr:hypothetical protein [Gandjariella thermophila]GDY33131.1 hypothetical protein GTS_47640 [Gandjariella thermophila]
MPIRTNRGRAAVYRRLWGWPLRSPKHLVTALVAVAVLAVVVSVALNKAGVHRVPPPGPAGAQRFAGAPSSATTTSPLPTRLESPLAAPTSAPPDPAALAVAEAWGKAWANHPAGMTTQQWLAQLAPYTTDEYLPVMASVDPANIPAHRVTGRATAVNSFTSSVQANLPTDGGTLSITVIMTPQGWRVSGYTKAG